jgi:hypothetical protein
MRRIVLGGFLLLGLSASAGCKQGLLERCQITTDCEDGLVCANDGVCRESTGEEEFDASIGIDASPFDADNGEPDDAGAGDAQ